METISKTMLCLKKRIFFFIYKLKAFFIAITSKYTRTYTIYLSFKFVKKYIYFCVIKSNVAYNGIYSMRCILYPLKHFETAYNISLSPETDIIRDMYNI